MVVDTKQLWDPARGLLAREAMSSDEVYQLELERIFGRAWLFIGHDSLVPNPNDFFLTYMGEDPVILTRDAKGQVHAFLNMCRHRGNRVARADDGNAKNFMCTYHGWTYSNEGTLVSVPGLQEAYYGELDVDKLGLVSVAQIDTYAGFIFATWDPEAPNLEDYLGDIRWYMDMWFNRREGGLELIGPDKWVGKFNWKMAADNFSNDGYHVHVSHRSATLAITKTRGQEPPPIRYTNPGSYNVAPGNGHGMGIRHFESVEQADTMTGQLLGNQVLKGYNEEIKPETERRLGQLRGRRMQMIVSSIFPNMSYLYPSQTIRLWMPRGPIQTEVWAFSAIDKAASDEVKEAARRDYLLRFGPSGMFEQDDMDNWRQSTESGLSQTGRQTRHQIVMAIGHEIHNHPELPGTLWPNINEGPQRALYSRWQECLSAQSWADISVAPQTAVYEGTATFKG